MTSSQNPPRQNQNRRQKNKSDLYDLAPTESPNQSNNRDRKKRKKNNENKPKDDTPREFARLMNWGAKGSRPRNALDDGDDRSRKRKRGGEQAEAGSAEAQDAVADNSNNKKSSSTHEDLKPLPSESLRDFYRRVDATIKVPLKGAAAPNQPPKDKKKKKDAEESTNENENEDNYDFDDNGDLLPASQRPKSSKRHAKNRSPSPFADLEAKRPKRAGINDVVQAPPSISAKPSNKLRSVMDVPKAAGSLAKREALAQERMDIVQKYRALMEAKRGG